jgi:hypothetical protein
VVCCQRAANSVAQPLRPACYENYFLLFHRFDLMF